MSIFHKAGTILPVILRGCGIVISSLQAEDQGREQKPNSCELWRTRKKIAYDEETDRTPRCRSTPNHVEFPAAYPNLGNERTGDNALQCRWRYAGLKSPRLFLFRP